MHAAIATLVPVLLELVGRTGIAHNLIRTFDLIRSEFAPALLKSVSAMV